MGYEKLENNRSKRFEELVKPLNKVSYADFKRIKFDRQFPSKMYFPANIDSLFLLDAAAHPDIADIINNLKTWDKKTDAQSIGAGNFFFVYTIASKKWGSYFKNKGIKQEDAITILREAKATMMKDFGRTNIQLGEVQKLVRGNIAIPLPGLPDVLAPMYSIPYKNGLYKGNQGDAYIELVRFTKDGPIIESLNVYGASARKNSPHYTDQMEIYTKQETKTMTLNKAEVYKNAVSKYHPQ
jgi:acyl-homoserine-lactone acylase